MNAVMSMLPGAIAIAVLASWIVLAMLGLVRIAGHHPLARRPVRRIAQVAVVTGIVGACVFAWGFASFMDGMRHFDTGIPMDERAILDTAFWVAVAVGIVLGVVAARHLRGRPGYENAPSGRADGA